MNTDRLEKISKLAGIIIAILWFSAFEPHRTVGLFIVHE
jgi:hypothetical protein